MLQWISFAASFIRLKLRKECKEGYVNVGGSRAGTGHKTICLFQRCVNLDALEKWIGLLLGKDKKINLLLKKVHAWGMTPHHDLLVKNLCSDHPARSLCVEPIFSHTPGITGSAVSGQTCSLLTGPGECRVPAIGVHFFWAREVVLLRFWIQFYVTLETVMPQRQFAWYSSAHRKEVTDTQNGVICLHDGKPRLNSKFYLSQKYKLYFFLISFLNYSLDSTLILCWFWVYLIVVGRSCTLKSVPLGVASAHHCT